jgi:hypothetical protein
MLSGKDERKAPHRATFATPEPNQQSIADHPREDPGAPWPRDSRVAVLPVTVLRANSCLSHTTVDRLPKQVYDYLRSSMCLPASQSVRLCCRQRSWFLQESWVSSRGLKER